MLVHLSLEGSHRLVGLLEFPCHIHVRMRSLIRPACRYHLVAKLIVMLGDLLPEVGELEFPGLHLCPEQLKIPDEACLLDCIVAIWEC